MVIDFQTWITFAIASEFILLIPGPTILLVVAYSLSHGKTATFPLVTGVGLGDFTAMVFSFTGLGLLLNQASELFTLFKWVGAPLPDLPGNPALDDASRINGLE